MPRTKKTSVKKTIEMEREIEMGQPQSEYPRRRTTPRTAARRSSAVGTRAASKATVGRAVGRKAAKKSKASKAPKRRSTAGRGRAKRGAR